MRRKELGGIVFLVLLFIHSAVSPQPQFVRTFGGGSGDLGRCIVQATDGGYIIAGQTNSYGAGGSDMLLSKLDGSGNHQWTRTVGGSEWDDGYAVVEASDGGYVMTGFTYSFGAGMRDVLLVKIDASGSHQWTRTLGGTDWDIGYSVIQSSDGGFVIAGGTASFAVGAFDVLIAKFDDSGNPLWTRTLGESNNEEAYSLVGTSDGGYAVAGYTTSFGAGETDVLLAKLDSVGNHEWTRTLGDDSADEAHSLIQTSDGGYAIAGFTTGFGVEGSDFLLAKLDGSGNPQWTRTLGGLLSEKASSLIQTSDGGYAIAGWTQSFGTGWDLLVAKFDVSGGYEWAKSLGLEGYNEVHAMTPTSDGGSAMSVNTGEVLVAKLDASGNTCTEHAFMPTVQAVTPTVIIPTPTVVSHSPTVTIPSCTITNPDPETTTVCVAEGEFVRADAEGDMDVEMSDAIFTLQALYVPGSDTLECKDAGDSDDNGSIEMSDAIYTLKYLYVPGAPEPPTPFPSCGSDPTEDGLDCAGHPCMGGR